MSASKLGVEPQVLVRKDEDMFKQSYRGKTLNAETEENL
jgi:hypothetical protein